MSRTDIHRPWRVLIEDPTIRHWFYEWRGQIMPSGACPNLCGCKLCNWQYSRHYSHRQERMRWRQVRQEAIKMAPVDYEDFDEGLIQGSPWY
jgi:hypothetical protein